MGEKNRLWMTTIGTILQVKLKDKDWEKAHKMVSIPVLIHRVPNINTVKEGWLSPSSSCEEGATAPLAPPIPTPLAAKEVWGGVYRGMPPPIK